MGCWVNRGADPIRNLKDVKNIKRILSDRRRDYAMFVFGINTNLRASDILRVKIGQVKYLSAGDSFELTEKKTGKKKRVTLNGSVVSAVSDYLSECRPRADDDEFLFVGQRGRMTTETLGRMVKRWCREVNLKGNFSSHTLRKTWGYHQRVTYRVDIARLMVCFNHKKPEQTLAYLGIQPEEIESVYMNEL
jgi:integrase